MAEKILRTIEKLIPKKLYKMGQPIYHFILALIGMCIYRFPARKMIVIGVTGTKGKTSTTNFIHSVLSMTGEKVGLISTANIMLGEKEIPNKYHMSMPGRFFLQKILRDIKNAGCKYVVLEVTSEGIKQWRHLGLFLDIVIFTNLSPEHLASHGGSFDKYREAKSKIFRKSIFNRPYLALINSDDESANYFVNTAKDIERVEYSLLDDVKNIEESEDGVRFNYQDYNYDLYILGRFNIYNALPAIILGKRFGLEEKEINLGLSKLRLIPGRMEIIEEGQNFKVIVDYAHEKLSMNSLLDTAKSLKVTDDNSIIVVLGGDGGGRDEERLYDMGRVVGEKADIVIVSNSDPYFDDEMTLAQKIAGEADKAGKRFNENLFIILDRGDAIKKAIEIAKEGDVVLLTTRGSLNTMSIKGKKVSSDDRVIAREVLRNLLNKNN